MSGVARREQLVAVGRSLFAEKGFDATTITADDVEKYGI